MLVTKPRCDIAKLLGDSADFKPWYDFASSLFNLLPPTAQKDLDKLAKMEHRMQSREPLLLSQDNQVTISLIDLHLLRARQFEEKLDMIAEEINEIRQDFLSLKDVDVEALEKKLTNFVSDIEIHEMKVKDYGNEKMPEVPSLSSVKFQLTERESLRAQVSELREKGNIYDGVDNFNTAVIRRMLACTAPLQDLGLFPEMSQNVQQVEDSKPTLEADHENSTEKGVDDLSNEGDSIKNQKPNIQKGVDASPVALDEYSYTQRDNFTSEIFKVEVGNLPFYTAPSDFKKLLSKRLALQPHKIKLFNISRSRFAFVTFKNEELRNAAIKVLDGYKYKQVVLRAGLAKPQADPVQKAKKRAADYSRDAPPEKKAILEIVIPWHATDYEIQLQWKQESIDQLLIKLSRHLSRQQNKDYNDTVNALKKVTGRKTICRINQICRSPRTEHYRNKNEFTPGWDENGAVVVGFRKASYKKGSLEVGGVTEEMKHVPPLAVKVTRLFEEYLQACASFMPPYNAEREDGYWRQLTVRTSEKGQCMMVVVMHPQSLSAQEIQEEMDKLKVFYETKLKSTVTSFYFQLFDKNGSNHPFKHLAGNTVIVEELLGLTFEISPPSFFQINTKSAEILYERVAELANVNKTTTILDLFCGTGSIGLSMASRAKRIIGAEIIPEAIKNAQKVAERHGITNAEFIAGKTEDVLSLALSKVSDEEDVVAILDPPRQGAHNRVVKLLRGHSKISRIVYVACNPDAAMQNILDLCKQPSNNYRGDSFVPIDAQPVDMFPHTPHTELIVMMKRLNLVKIDVANIRTVKEVIEPTCHHKF
ncbi:tRNA (uracil-5-)-methyltransferaseA-like [Tropilaelaps mercedesae]|uniref:tRNA (uracil(54)-C(5))-methyltransferase n=1 Tax=Tropilaelaps mercedesae TaxID=418985 RepID=A0A1V9X9Y2_9ACAR|nr:tRNA (uracil-5-)-methyltransferaseA-like [Tropilaelaps mercedesae]